MFTALNGDSRFLQVKRSGEHGFPAVHHEQADHKQQTVRQPFLFALPVTWKESGKLSRPQTAYEIPSNGV